MTNGYLWLLMGNGALSSLSMLPETRRILITVYVLVWFLLILNTLWEYHRSKK